MVCHTKLWYKRFAETHPRGKLIDLISCMRAFEFFFCRSLPSVDSLINHSYFFFAAESVNWCVHIMISNELIFDYLAHLIISINFVEIEYFNLFSSSACLLQESLKYRLLLSIQGVRLAQKFEALVLADQRFEIPAVRHLGKFILTRTARGSFNFTCRHGSVPNQRWEWPDWASAEAFESSRQFALCAGFAEREICNSVSSSQPPPSIWHILERIPDSSFFRFTVTSSHTTNDDILKDWAEVRSVTTDLLEELNVKVGDRARVLLRGFIFFILFFNIFCNFLARTKFIHQNYLLPCFSVQMHAENRFLFQRRERRTKHSVQVCCWPIRRCHRKLSTDRLRQYSIQMNFWPKLMPAFE